jgi:hypothetical protein
MTLPTGNFTDFNVPDGTIANMSAGQGVVFRDLISESRPEGDPSTCAGFIKELKITVAGETLDFYQGMKQVLINSIEIKTDVILHFKGFEWILDNFQMQRGNAAVDETDPTKKVWGIGGEASKRDCKALIYHKLLEGQYIWIYIWKMSGDGNFGLEFADADWFAHDYDFKLHKSDTDFAGDATDYKYLMVEEYPEAS